MATETFRAGVADILLPQQSQVAVPSLLGVSFSASAYTPDTTLYNSILKPLASGNYQIAIGLVGWDNTTSGYSVAPTTVSSGQVVIGQGQVIKVVLPVANWPANLSYASDLAIFIAAGNSTNFQLAKRVPIYDDVNAQVNLETFVFTLPDVSVQQIPISTLASTNTVSPNALGNRAPLGWTWYLVSPTSGDVVITYEAGSQITFTPNNSSDFTLIGARPLSLSFQGMVNSDQQITQATSGDYMQATDGGITYQESQWGMNTSKIVFKGVSPVMVHFPPDPTTLAQTLLLFTGLLLQNQTQVALAWSKRNETNIPFNYQPVPMEFFNNSTPTAWARCRFNAVS